MVDLCTLYYTLTNKSLNRSLIHKKSDMLKSLHGMDSLFYKMDSYLQNGKVARFKEYSARFGSRLDQKGGFSLGQHSRRAARLIWSWNWGAGPTQTQTKGSSISSIFFLLEDYTSLEKCFEITKNIDDIPDTVYSVYTFDDTIIMSSWKQMPLIKSWLNCAFYPTW